MTFIRRIRKSSGNAIKFNTVPGTHQFTVGNVIVNGLNYTPEVYTGNVVAGNVTTIQFLAPVCTITLNSNSISFGALYPATTHPDNINILDTNNGTATANVFVSGTNWLTGSNAFAFGVSNTSWSAFSIGSLGTSLLSNTPVNTNIYVPASSYNSIYFGLSVPGAIPAGTYTQTIVIENSC